MSTSRFLFALCIGITFAAREARATNYTWTENAADLDNVITNAAHLPVPLESITCADSLTIKATADMTVRMPEGTYTGVLSPYFDVAAGCTLTYDGTGVWKQQDIAEGSYIVGTDGKGKSHFRFLSNGNPVFSYDVNAKAGTYSFDGVKFRLRRAATGSETWFDLDRGTMNFYDPNGTGHTENLYTVGGSSSPVTLAFHEGSALRTPVLFVYGEHAKTYVVFDGGEDHYVHKFSPRSLNAEADTSVDRTVLLVTGAGTKLTMAAFSYGNAQHHRYRVDVVSNATLHVRSEVGQHPERADTDRFYVTEANVDLGYDGLANAYWSAPNLFASNMTFHGLANKTKFRYAGVVRATNSTFTAKVFSIANNVDFEQVGGSLVTTGDAYFGTDDGSSCVRFDGAEVSFGANAYIGDTSISVMTLTNTTVRTTDKTSLLTIGNGVNADGTLNVGDGATLDCAHRLVLSGLGRAALNVGDGGTVKAAELQGVWTAGAQNKAIRLHQTGGLVSVGLAKLVTDGSSKDCTVVYQLDGGEFHTSSIDGGRSSAAVPTATTTAFVKGNGGTIVATGGSTEFIRNLNGLLAGAKGLTVLSDYDITIPQSVGNEEGAEGRLILTGSGVKTLSGTATDVSVIEVNGCTVCFAADSRCTSERIIVNGGTVKFAEGSHCASKLILLNGGRVEFEEDPANVGLTGLVVGDETSVGYIELAVGQTLAIDGDVELNRVRIVLTGDYALDTTHALLTATGEVSAASQAAWADALIAAGAGADRSYEFTTDTATPGVTALRMSVAESAFVITLPEGESNATENVTFGGNARLKVDVGAEADLTISGKLQKGGVNKVGAGRLELTNAGNLFLSGLFAGGGILSVGSVASLGWDAESVAGVVIRTDTFEYTGDGETMPGSLVFNGTNRTAAVVLKNEGDLTVTNISTVSGAPIKRGAGTLTVTPPSGSTTTLAVWHGSSADNNHYDPGSFAPFSFAADGAAPQTGYLGFNVAEGKIVFRGDATTTVSIPYTIGIALCNNDAVSVAPALVFDGVKANLCTAHPNDRIMLGDFYKGPTKGPGAYPRLEILNGADVTATSIMAGRQNDSVNWPTAVVDHASLKLSSFYPGWSSSSHPGYLIRNATFVSGNVDHYGPYWIELSGGSTWSGTSAGACFVHNNHYKGMNESGWTIGDGSSVSCSQFVLNGTANANPQVIGQMPITFDGGTWYTGDGEKPTFHIWRSTNLVFKTTGAGLTIPVGEGKTVDVARAFMGDGPLIKTGAGTLHFETQGTWDQTITEKTALADPVSLAFEGTLDVREGAVTVDATACRTGGAYKTAEGASVDFSDNALGSATLAGAGSFANASVSGGAIGVELTDAGTVEGCPSFTGVTFSNGVRVDFGRTEPLEGEYKDLVVATFPNGAPDVSGWRSRNTGKGTRATFRVADNGKDVLADVAPTGLILLFR